MMPDSEFTHTKRDSAIKFITWRFSDVYLLISQCEGKTLTYCGKRLIVEFCKEYKEQYRLHNYTNRQISERIRKTALKNFDEILDNAI